MRKYTETHEWVEASGPVATIGISDFAQKELGEIVSVELPRVGSHIEAQQQIAVLESTKAAVDIYSPVSGEITAVNSALLDAPNTINTSAETHGWLIKLKLANSSELTPLMDATHYHTFISS